MATLADVLTTGLTSLATVTVCADDGGCATPVFLHPGTLDAIAIVQGGGRLTVRPGATRALGRSLEDGRQRPLPLVARAGHTEIDTRALRGLLVLRLAGWAGGSDARDLPLSFAPPSPIPFHDVVRYAPNVLLAWSILRDRLERTP